MTILDTIVAKKKISVARQKKAVPLAKLLVSLDGPLVAPRFKKTLSSPGIHLIAEIKKASPSAGIICERFDYLSFARAFETAGATGLSVLTENDFFQGRLSYFDDIREAVQLPLLRKDFIIDTYQVYESKLHRADAILLIASLYTRARLERQIELCKKLKLDALVEVHDRAQLNKALDAGASFLGINTRDLRDFSVDLGVLPELLKAMPKRCVVVAESGIKGVADLSFLKKLDINAVLVGEALMRASDPGRAALAFVDNLKR